MTLLYIKMIFMTDQETIQLYLQCLQGDSGAQRKLYSLYNRSLYMICLRYGRDVQEAQDMLQEGFIKVFTDLYQYDASRGALYTWMRRVVINSSLQYLRRNKKIEWETVSMDDMGHQDMDEFTELHENKTKKILNLLRQLPEGYRVVFNLYVMEGYTHPEIAEWLGITVGTSKSQLSKAKSLLRKWMFSEVELWKKPMLAAVNDG